MAVALAPEPPLVEWIAEIEQKIKDTGNFLVGPPVVLDLSAVKLSKSAIAHLLAQLEQRGVRVMGIENADPSQLDAALPPLRQDQSHGQPLLHSLRQSAQVTSPCLFSCPARAQS